MALVDTTEYSRLMAALTNANLATKNNPLYQILKQLIGLGVNFSKFTQQVADESALAGIVTPNQIIQQILSFDNFDESQLEPAMIIPGPRGSTGVAGSAGIAGMIGPPGLDGMDGQDGDCCYFGVNKQFIPASVSSPSVPSIGGMPYLFDSFDPPEAFDHIGVPAIIPISGWIQTIYSSADYFSGTAFGTWTVDSGDVTTSQYIKIGSLCLFMINLDSTSIINTPTSEPTQLRIVTGIVPKKAVAVTCLVYDNSITVGTVCRAFMLASSGFIGIDKLDGSAFIASTNNTHLRIVMPLHWEN